MKSTRIILVVTSLLLLASPVSAFDDNRKGFSLSLGLGLHSLSYDYSIYGETVISESESGWATSFKIGGGFSEQFQLYYLRNVSWYSASTEGESKTYTIGLTGVGGTYYLNPVSPTVYFTGGLGAGDITGLFDDHIRGDTGNASLLGVGYEFRPHVQLEAVLLSTDILISDFSTVELNTTSLQVTLNYHWY